MKRWLAIAVLWLLADPASGQSTRPYAGQAEAWDQLFEASGVGFSRLRFLEREPVLVAPLEVREVWDDDGLAELESGIPTVIVVTLTVRDLEQRAVSNVRVSADVTYDLWRDEYIVRQAGPIWGQNQRREWRVHDQKKAASLASNFGEVMLAPLTRFKSGSLYFVDGLVQRNPVSPELISEARRWLSRPAATAELSGSGALFGSVVSVFVNPRIKDADRVYSFWSQPFFRAKP